MPDLSFDLAHHVATYDAQQLPSSALRHISLDLIDAIAATIGGIRAPGVTETRNVISRGAAAGVATVFGTMRKLPAVAAAQVNATAGHALDFDDTLDEGGGMHAGVPIHMAALALAEELGGVRGTDYAAATALGLDVAVRLALATKQDFGWHRTSAYGIFGVAVAASRLLKLDEEQTRHALGIAYSQASGNRQCIPDAALSKRLQSGFGARDGITSALLAQVGLTGATNSFEGRDGFFKLYQRDAYDRDTVLENLGSELWSEKVSLKPYPCGRNLHTLIDVALALRARSEVREISRVVIELDGPAAARANPVYPRHVVEAQFSAAFAVALALSTGAATLASFDQPDEVSGEVKALFAKVEFRGRETPTGESTVEVIYADASRDVEGTSVASGNPKKPQSQAQVAQKLADCNSFAGDVFTQATLAEITKQALGLGELADVRDLVGLLAVQ